MSAAIAWLNATLAGTAGGISLLAYGALGNSTPGTTGAGDLTTTPGIPRQAFSWSSPASASSGNSAAMSWAVPSSTTGIGWVLLFSASTAGTYYTDLVIPTPINFSSAGNLQAAIGGLTLGAAQSA